MRLPSFLACLTLSLAGCNYAPNTSITTTTVNGVDVLDSVIRESTPGVAEFECRQSASGTCHYAVFTSNCASGKPADAAAPPCTTRRIAEFALAAGESKWLRDLPPDYRHCVAQTTPRAPSCARDPRS